MLDDVMLTIRELEQIIRAVQQRPGPTSPEVQRRANDALERLGRVKATLESRQGKARGRRLQRKQDGR
jgi:hypothetical protein